MAITDWPALERPREKLLAHGASVLSDAELLAIFLRTGIKGVSAVDLARDLLKRFGGLRPLLESSQDDFCEALGLGPAKYAQLQAVLEMSRRHLMASLQRGELMESPGAVRQYLLAQMRHHQQEVFACLFLDNKHRIIRFEPLFYGTIDAASVYPREVVKKSLSVNAAAVILAHNHPSGVAEPSLADKQITRRLIDALMLVDIRVLDHMIVGDSEVVSFAELGLL
ncbi:RadC family protein [Neptunomonas qingdaonensis]|uniref:DNA repair protein RadC n=1 Tax=Neptunomonas qingdaonensis TaxID=1045558 RepID=A0A1I2WBB8_9GAMM|nr:DNA repair protein RadC [Neptunomonas qingdaonensis]SFG98673.1 DNA repair protein RadC [Neptunomonas qingdaonensis]